MIAIVFILVPRHFPFIVQMLPIISYGNMAMVMDSGKIHFISAWSNDDEEDSRAKEKTVHF